MNSTAQQAVTPRNITQTAARPFPSTRAITKTNLPYTNFREVEVEDGEFVIWSEAHRDHLRDERAMNMVFSSRYRATLHIACISHSAP